MTLRVSGINFDKALFVASPCMAFHYTIVLSFFLRSLSFEDKEAIPTSIQTCGSDVPKPNYVAYTAFTLWFKY